MKRIIASLLAASALAAAGAAAAQTSVEDRIDRLQDRVDRSEDQNLITENQAEVFRNQLQGVRDTRERLEDQGMLNDANRRDLNDRLDRLADGLGRDEYYTRNGSYRGYHRDWDSEDEDGAGSPY